MNAEQYKNNPCRASSLPYWKTERFAIPGHVSVIRDDLFCGAVTSGKDEPYFKVIHHLETTPEARLPEGFEVCTCGIGDYAAHINTCYETEGIRPDELEEYLQHPVYYPLLWIAVHEKSSQRLAATGIAELDRWIGEGILEWIQVSPEYRRQGLGRFIVCQLLRRMAGRAGFVTVSGKLDSDSDPLALYTSCGFTDPVIWHVIRTE